MRVHLVPSSTRLQVAQDVEVTVPAQGEATVGVPITAVGSGEVTVSIDLLAADGTRVGTPVSILTRVHADWESMGTRVVAVLLALVLIVGPQWRGVATWVGALMTTAMGYSTLVCQ